MAQNFQQQPNDPNQQGFPPQPPYGQPQQQYMPQQAPKKPVYKKWWCRWFGWKQREGTCPGARRRYFPAR